MGQIGDFFLGLLYTNAIETPLNRVDPRFPAGRFLEQFAVGKAVGVELAGDIPAPEALTDHAGWSWFLIAPPSTTRTDSALRAEALRKVYCDAHIVSLAVEHPL